MASTFLSVATEPTRGTSEPPSRTRRSIIENATEDDPTADLRDVEEEYTPRRSSERSQSWSSVEDSSFYSHTSSPRHSIRSSLTTPSLYNFENHASHFIGHAYRPSVLARLKSSVNLASMSTPTIFRAVVAPTDFRATPEQPERHFVDAIGMVLPGVCDRTQCEYPFVHHVSTFRLCDPIEYTTPLADHGITYTDYCRLVTLLQTFLDDVKYESRWWKKHSSLLDLASDEQPARSRDTIVSPTPSAPTPSNTVPDETEHFGSSKQHATNLNQLLEDITHNLRFRGVPVHVSVHSFSIFAPSRISEAHIQILHVPLNPDGTSPDFSPTSSRSDLRYEKRLSFINPTTLASLEGRSPRPHLEQRNMSTTSTGTNTSSRSRPHSQSRDRSKPSALWPNAIPTRKRQVMSENADRYGQDPFFRAWMRANINSRTRSNTYAKYMIERENDPFVNMRLDYTDTVPRGALLMDVWMKGSQALKEQFPNTVNRAKYDHNRRLECRKTIEHGTRSRLLRFGFRHGIYPPHTPEMDALGLSKAGYQKILHDIDAIHSAAHPKLKSPMAYVLASLSKIRGRSTEDVLMKVSDYLRGLNASQRNIVWTIEKVPGVYDRGLARDRTEWEISAWNGEDPLELVIQLERWGIIENRLNVVDDDD